MSRYKIDSFNGGINNWLDEELLAPQFAVELRNADISNGVVQSARDAGTSGTPSIADNASVTRSVVNWLGTEYWSENVTGGLGSSLGYIGVEPPTAAPTIKLGSRGTRFVGRYRYAINYESADGFLSGPPIDKGEIKITEINSEKPAVNLNTGDYEEFSATHVHPNYVGAHSTFYGYTVGDRVNYSGRSWECIQLFHNGRIGDRGILAYVQPAQYPGVNFDIWKDITDTVISSEGVESFLLDIPQPSEGIVSKINIYRSIADGGDMYFVASVATGKTSFVDKVPDEEILLNEKMSLEILLPPIYEVTSNTFTRLSPKFLTELDGVFYAAIGTKVYLSEQNNPHAWNPINYVIVPDEVTAIAKESNAVLIETANRSYRLSGTTLSDVVLQNLRVGQGCPNWRTVAYMRNTPVWLSNDGVCFYQSQTNLEGKFVQVATEGAYHVPEGSLFAASANDRYYLFFEDYFIEFDARDGIVVKERVGSFVQAIYDQDVDTLYLQDSDGDWFTLGTGDEQEFTYKSPRLNMGEKQVKKRFRKIWFDASGAVTIDVYVDGELAKTMTDDGTGRRRRFLSAGMRGEDIQFRITGTGKLNGIEVEYSVLSGGR